MSCLTIHPFNIRTYEKKPGSFYYEISQLFQIEENCSHYLHLVFEFHQG